MKHHGWIVFAIVGLVLVTGLALMYSGGDLKTAGEAKKFGQQYGSQQLPQPPATTTYAPQLPAPPKLSVYNGGSVQIGIPVTYTLDGTFYRTQLYKLVPGSSAGCMGADGMIFEINGVSTVSEICQGGGRVIHDGSVIVFAGTTPYGFNFVHIR